MKKDLRLKLRLTEIPEEGKSFTYTQKDPEALRALQEFVGNLPFEVKIHLQPINHAHFELKGVVKAASPQQCSRCAEDFQCHVTKNIHEIMIPELDVGRTERYAKTNVPEEESDLSSLFYSPDMIFDLGEYLHEVVALALPENPAPPVVAEQCMACPKKVVPGAFDYDETTPEAVRPSPFEVLKNLKM